MARSRRPRPDLTESWDAVDGSDTEPSYTEQEEREELGTSYVSSRTRARTETPEPDEATDTATPLPPRTSSRQLNGGGGGSEARKRMSKSGMAPELVMPTTFDGSPGKGRAKMRASTPHFRMNARSLTSDAGKFNVLSGGGSAEDRRAAKKRIEDDWDDEIDEESDLQWPMVLWNKLLRPVLAYAGSIWMLATRQAKPYLALALLFYLVFGFGRNFLAYSVDQALSPLCRIPGISYFEPSFCPSLSRQELSGTAEFDKLVEAQEAFNDVLVTSAGSYSLPLEMKRSEASIRDLKHVVEYSTLPSRNELVFEFTGFIETARQASQDLSKFNSRIGRAVDHILSTNRWTLQTIEGVAADAAARGSIANWVSNNLNILAPFQPVPLNRDILLDQYLRHTGAVEEEIVRLINEAHALLTILENLDARLDVIANIATRDDIRAKDNKEELFALLWTKLGGNRSSVSKLEKQLQLLKDVGNYKRLAWAHVTGTIVKLQAIRDNLEDLRERVGMPEVLGDKIPLEVHIENINLGIERLEQQRDASKKIEAESHRRILDRAEAGFGGGRAIDGKEL